MGGWDGTVLVVNEWGRGMNGDGWMGSAACGVGASGAGDDMD